MVKRSLFIFFIFMAVIFIVACSERERTKFPDVKARDRIYLITNNGGLDLLYRFENAVGFSEGLARVRSDDGKWGYTGKESIVKGGIDAEKVVIKPQFDFAGNFSEGLAFVKLGNKYGYIDKEGKVVIKPQFDFSHDFSEGLACVMIGDKWGYIDKEGKLVIKPQFDFGDDFSEGLACVMIGDSYGYINKKGKMCEYYCRGLKHASRFSEGVALVELSREGGGSISFYIDKRGYPYKFEAPKK